MEDSCRKIILIEIRTIARVTCFSILPDECRLTRLPDLTKKQDFFHLGVREFLFLFTLLFDLLFQVTAPVTH